LSTSFFTLELVYSQMPNPSTINIKRIIPHNLPLLIVFWFWFYDKNSRKRKLFFGGRDFYFVQKGEGGVSQTSGS
jgi:hypothetical protein